MEPTRGVRANWHGYRCVPNRREIELLDVRGQMIDQNSDAYRRQSSMLEMQYVVSVQSESTTWCLPMIRMENARRPEVGHRIRELSTGRLWEIRSVQTGEASTVWHCPSVEMTLHEGAVA